MKSRSRSGPEQSVKLGRLGEFVGFRLKRIQIQLSQSFASLTPDDGLRSGLFSSLAIISANPGISQTDLSREVGLDKSVTVSIVHDLEELGWAERRRSERDRRRHELHITPSGAQRLDALFDALEKTENYVLQSLSAGERQLLSELLDRMYGAVTQGRR